MANGNTSPTPWKIATAILSATLAILATMWGMVMVHAGQPTHAGAVPRTEVERALHSVDRRLNSIEIKVDRLLIK